MITNDNGDKILKALLSENGIFYSARPVKKRIKAYPSSTGLTCEVGDIHGAVSLALALNRHKGSILSSSLLKLRSCYMCIKLKTKDIYKVLPDICEHSNRVFIGKDYLYVIKEHGKTLIPSNAAEIINSSLCRDG